jgi:hypothetical protein
MAVGVELHALGRITREKYLSGGWVDLHRRSGSFEKETNIILQCLRDAAEYLDLQKNIWTSCLLDHVLFFWVSGTAQ